MANQLQVSEPTQTADDDDDEESAVPTTSGSQDSADREIKNLKALVAQQSRQLRDLTKTVSELVAEVKNLKAA